MPYVSKQLLKTSKGRVGRNEFLPADLPEDEVNVYLRKGWAYIASGGPSEAPTAAVSTSDDAPASEPSVDADEPQDASEGSADVEGSASEEAETVARNWTSVVTEDTE